MCERQRYAEAQKLIERLPEQSPFVNAQSGMIVDVMLRTKNTADALKVAEKAVADNPKDYLKLLSLAQVYWALHLKTADRDMREKAEKSLREAVSIADKNPQTWTMLVVFLSQTDRREEAKKVIGQAASKLPIDKNRLAYAYCHEVVGDLKEAEQLYNASLKEAPNDVAALQAAAGFFLRAGKSEEAKPHLERITNLSQQFPEEAAKARQLLIIALFSEPGDYKGKLERLEKKLGFQFNRSAERASTESPDDKRIRALLLAAQGRRRDREEAVRTLDEISQLQPLTAGDQFNQAILNLSLGDTRSVRTLMQTVVEQREMDNPRYLAFYAQFLLDLKNPDEAQIWISKLEKVQPEAVRTFELKARLLHAQGKSLAAVDLLTSYAAKNKDAPLLPIAILLEQIGRTTGDYKPAELMYEEAVEQIKKPESLSSPRWFLQSHQTRAGGSGTVRPAACHLSFRSGNDHGVTDSLREPRRPDRSATCRGLAE